MARPRLAESGSARRQVSKKRSRSRGNRARRAARRVATDRRRDAVLDRIDRHVRERRDIWGPERSLEDALYTGEVLERKLSRDYEDLRRADREDYREGMPEGDAFHGRTLELR